MYKMREEEKSIMGGGGTRDGEGQRGEPQTKPERGERGRTRQELGGRKRLGETMDKPRQRGTNGPVTLKLAGKRQINPRKVQREGRGVRCQSNESQQKKN